MHFPYSLVYTHLRLGIVEVLASNDTVAVSMARNVKKQANKKHRALETIWSFLFVSGFLSVSIAFGTLIIVWFVYVWQHVLWKITTWAKSQQ